MNTNRLIFWIELAIATIGNIGTSVWLLLTNGQWLETQSAWQIITSIFVFEAMIMMVVLKPGIFNNYKVKIVSWRPHLVRRKANLPPDPYGLRLRRYGICQLVMSAMWFLLLFPIKHGILYIIPLFVFPLALIVIGLITYTEFQIKKQQ